MTRTRLLAAAFITTLLVATQAPQLHLWEKLGSGSASAQAPCVIHTQAQFQQALAQGLIAIQKFPGNASFNIWARACFIDPIDVYINKVIYPAGDPRTLVIQEPYYHSGYQPAMQLGEVRNFGAVPPGCGYQIDAFLPGGVSPATIIVGDIYNDPSILCHDQSACVGFTGPDQATAGQPVTYQVTMRNTGNTIWRPNIEQPYRLMSTNPNDKDNFGHARAELPGAVGPGQDATFTLSSTTPAAGSYSLDWEMGQESVKRGFGGLCQKTVTVSNPAPPPPTTTDLSIRKTGPATAAPGSNITYDLALTNNGPATTFNVDFTDPVPAGLTFVSSSDPAHCSQQGANVVCHYINAVYAVGTTAHLQLTFQVQGGAACSSQISNTASIASDNTTDPNPGNNQSTAATMVQCAAPTQIDLSAMKTGPSTVERGSTITYSLWAVIANGSTDTAHNVVLTDAIPSGLTFDAAHSMQSCTQQGSNIVCTFASLSPAQMKVGGDLAFTVGNGLACGATISNTLSVRADETDPVPGNNTQATPVTTTVQCTNATADLSIQKTGPSSVTRPAVVGQNAVLTYTLRVSNAGPATASGVIITDPVPTGLTFSASGSNAACVLQGSNVVCTIGAVTASQPRDMNVSFLLPGQQACQTGTIQNTATVRSSLSDPSANNNTSQTIATVIQCATTTQPFSISKTDNKLTVAAGETVTYQITVTNNLGSTSIVSAYDTLPSQLEYVSASDNPTVNGQNVAWQSFGLAPYGSKTFTLVARVAAGLENGTTIANTAQLSTGNSATDNDIVDNGTQQSGCVQIAAEAFGSNGNLITPVPSFTFRLDGNQTVTSDSSGHAVFNGVAAGSHTVAQTALNGWNVYQITPSNGAATVSGGAQCAVVSFKNQQSGSSNVFTFTKNDNRTAVAANDTVTYQLTVTNTSGAQQNNVTVTDTLPSQLSFVSASENGYLSGQTVTWPNGTLAAGQTKTLTLTARVNSGLSDGASIANTASVSGGTSTSAVTATDTDTVQGGVPPAPQGNVTVQKFADRSEARPSESIFYTVSIRNQSNAQISSLQVADTFPAQQMRVFDAGAGVIGTGRVDWTVSLAPGETRTFTYSGQLSPALAQGTVVHNAVQVTGSGIQAQSAAADVTISQIVPVVPQTGGSDALTPLENTRRFLSPVHGSASAGVSAIFWASIVLLGGGLGATLGRRYFL